jgi:hypothetical protein
LALPILVGFGIVEGVWTNRWQLSDATRVAAARLADVPARVGDWEGEDLELDAREVVKAELDGYLMRRYVHRTSGASVTVLLVCGRPGPVSVHTPDVCYGGAGYVQEAAAGRLPLETNPPAELWRADFRKTGSLPEQLHIAWCWAAAGAWTAPDNPRVTFARAPALYKLYVVRQVVGREEPGEKDPAADFLRQFLPEAQARLFPVPQS